MMKHKWWAGIPLVLLGVVWGCSDPVPNVLPEPEPPPVRDLPISTIQNPAVWMESSDKVVVNKLQPWGDDERYYFLLTTLGQKRTQVIGQTENRSIRRDYILSGAPSMYVNDMITYSYWHDPTQVFVGGTDHEDVYASTGDLDEFGLSPAKLSVASYIDFQGYKTQFTSICMANTLSVPLGADGEDFLIAGNGYADGTAHPFIATYNFRRYYQVYDSMTTATFFDAPGREFLRISYDFDDGLFVFAYDNFTNEVVVTRYQDVDVNGNHAHEKKDSFKPLWEKRLSLTIDKALFNVAEFDDTYNHTLYIAGTVKTGQGDTAGKIISLDAPTGKVLQDTVFDFSDKNDGFYGIAKSGENFFAYGYTEQVLSGSEPLSSKGWALKLSDQGKPLRNHIYEIDHAVIELTATVGGYEQNSWTNEGYVAVAGYRKVNGQYAAFATQFYHRYKEDF